jgi:hypothetical protein
VLEAAGTVLTNKYAEGYPGNRYYGGCQYVDEAETLAIERAKKLFKCRFANVQSHSGSTANQEAFMALMKPGDSFMGLSLAAGGHLTHGSPVNLSGKWFKVVPYGVRRQDHRIVVHNQYFLAVHRFSLAFGSRFKANGDALYCAGRRCKDSIVANCRSLHMRVSNLEICRQFRLLNRGHFFHCVLNGRQQRAMVERLLAIESARCSFPRNGRRNPESAQS